MHVVNDYRINRKTMAVVPHFGPDHQSKILETDREFYCTKTVNQIIERSCIEGGSTIAGRRKAMERILHTKVKLPIPINPVLGTFFFPSKSPKELNCYWFSFFHIEEYLKSKQGGTDIVFSNQTTTVIDTSFLAFRRQMFLTATAIADLSRQILWFDFR
ncbi:competence protein ComK [Salinibacillus kushneri]|uniref:Competence protein ComK n=1 Tax=Salinibacillus kushneri TaxID=237682 RepID=A0A1I0D0F1_9BACI|nr:competence protein ComK [Salinibacillus kushneri]SET25398.1 competence protein ComK [Salinibacillus kushneri]